MSGSFAGWDEATLQRAADLVTGELTLEQELELRSTVDPLALEEFELAAGELSLLVRREDVPDDSASVSRPVSGLEIQRGAVRPHGSHAAGRRSSAARGPLGAGGPAVLGRTSCGLDRRPGLGPGPRLAELDRPHPRSARRVTRTRSQRPTPCWPRPPTRSAWTGSTEVDPLASSRGRSAGAMRPGSGRCFSKAFPRTTQKWPSTSCGSSMGPARTQRAPVDGGVFDVTGDETRVAIDAHLPGGEATLFAVTLERPGGVVVSSRERLMLTASVQ